VTLSRRETTIQIGIRWQTEAFTQLEIPRPQKSWEKNQTSSQAVALIRELAPNHSDKQIAAALNEAGLRAGYGGEFTASKVSWIRYAHQIPTGCRESPARNNNQPRGYGRYSAKAAANILNVDVSTIADWRRAGRLDSVRTTRPWLSPWSFTRPPVGIPCGLLSARGGEGRAYQHGLAKPPIVTGHSPGKPEKKAGKDASPATIRP
jgi:hypothetical protein